MVGQRLITLSNRALLQRCVALQALYSPRSSRTAVPLVVGLKRTASTCSVGKTTAKPLNEPPRPPSSSCPGCGAFVHTGRSGEPGHIKDAHGSLSPRSSSSSLETRAFQYSLQRMGADALDSLGIEEYSAEERPDALESLPLCDRCHSLVHHQQANPILTPAIKTIAEMINMSPHAFNHVYHVLDAADFPLSLVSGLHNTLALSPQRGRNRRAKSSRFSRRRLNHVSFVITRSDLLSSSKEQVDSMLPYLRQVLRESLGSKAGNARLGNVHCISSRRGWWTKTLKEDIWARGGGNWLVGKVNVGKSSLYESVFPKGRAKLSTSPESRFRHSSSDADESGLLPPMPTELLYPPMPTVSHVPGTTAAPVRNSFGGGKGELIDLPGFQRGGFQEFVLDKYRRDLVMQRRLKPLWYNVGPGQSAILSNLVRITPLCDAWSFQLRPFVPLQCLVMETARAEAVMLQSISPRVGSVATQRAAECMASAGTFDLRWDITKERCGSLGGKHGTRQRSRFLPFRVLSCDVLLEGVGWVEVTAQVRRADSEGYRSSELYAGLGVEVFTPNGKGIACRRPLISFQQQNTRQLIQS